MKTRTSTNGSSGLRKKPGAGGCTGTERGESGVFMSKGSHSARPAPNAASGAFGKIAQPRSGCGLAATGVIPLPFDGYCGCAKDLPAFLALNEHDNAKVLTLPRGIEVHRIGPGEGI